MVVNGSPPSLVNPQFVRSVAGALSIDRATVLCRLRSARVVPPPRHYPSPTRSSASSAQLSLHPVEKAERDATGRPRSAHLVLQTQQGGKQNSKTQLTATAESSAKSTRRGTKHKPRISTRQPSPTLTISQTPSGTLVIKTNTKTLRPNNLFYKYIFS